MCFSGISHYVIENDYYTSSIRNLSHFVKGSRSIFCQEGEIPISARPCSGPIHTDISGQAGVMNAASTTTSRSGIGILFSRESILDNGDEIGHTEIEKHFYETRGGIGWPNNSLPSQRWRNVQVSRWQVPAAS